MLFKMFGKSKNAFMMMYIIIPIILNTAPFHVNAPKNKTLLQTCNNENLLERRPEIPIPHANIRCSGRSIRQIKWEGSNANAVVYQWYLKQLNRAKPGKFYEVGWFNKSLIPFGMDLGEIVSGARH